MQLTRIEEKNREYFTHICPETLLDNEDIVKFGVINDDGYAAGVCAVGIQENMAVIHWLMTDESFREQGVASFLIGQVEELIKDMGLTGIEIRFKSTDEDLDAFLADHEFMVGVDSQVYSVPIEDIVYSREMDLILETEDESSLVHRFPYDDAEKNKLIEYICREYELDKCIFDGISSTYSFVYIDEDRKMSGAVCITEYGEKDLYVNYLVSNGSIKCISDIIRALYDTVTTMDRTSGNLWFSDRSESAISLIERFTQTDRDEFRVSGRNYAVKLFV
ncbi:hypothetical protein SAMN02910292_02152 [Lachnospiraceae bacterium XBB2008]|nr:hypothetical protein SAMN02910292_02152 [Lachnospiraceae bacterium XBB2008]